VKSNETYDEAGGVEAGTHVDGNSAHLGILSPPHLPDNLVVVLNTPLDDQVVLHCQPRRVHTRFPYSSSPVYFPRCATSTSTLLGVHIPLHPSHDQPRRDSIHRREQGRRPLGLTVVVPPPAQLLVHIRIHAGLVSISDGILPWREVFQESG
jgi:hypothetical protein